ncbi:MAG: 16S rRNA (adenine(1518)-N(6)/adenine(1519)-N(6))-dimethyltransferase RsmA [Enterobacteriaceae bacterium PSpicST2]|nr:MAG: 16S rRNA (adenine(1518)-N(6)/adenine(1519)-N(6))-dimethyltransferase RsmA [Enterobacteriaceae bacterium PSpicST2]WMC19098.1 MAG: 16S rRNA (adenine(1518)-N(6)/adenine(1519)-N(6))-dimethyltransferase RsmA [Enterobacteriaceae bacterium PSpicST1]
MFIKKFTPKKKLGQNFLNNLYIIKKIIKIIKIKKKNILIEIGVGFGIISKLIILNINKIILIEIDKNLIFFLKKFLQFKNKKILIYKKNIFKINLLNIAKKECKLIKLFGNIPYNISTNLIFYIIKYLYYIKCVYILLQKEFFDKIIYIINKKKPGRLNIIIKYYFIIKPIFKISKNAFIPKPKIESIFLIIKPFKKKYFVNNINNLKLVIKKSFKQRRKKIKNNFKNLFSKKQLKLIKINPNNRAENILLSDFCILSNLITINKFYKNKYYKI